MGALIWLAAASGVAEETAGAKFQHVTALSEMPAEQMGKVMNIISQSLGVNCQYCHAGNDFAKEQVGHKEVAREMIAMTLKLNQDVFRGRDQITCFTCHRGQARPENSLSLDGPAVTRSAKADSLAKQDNTDPAKAQVSVASVLAKYRQVLGPVEKRAAINSLHMVGERVEPNGQTEPEEFKWSKTGRSQLETHYGQLAIYERYDGTVAKKLVGERAVELKADEARQIVLEGQLVLGRYFDTESATLAYEGQRVVGNAIVNMLVSTETNGVVDRWMFDNQTGLLVRRVSTLQTVLGPFEYQVDYSDYRPIHEVLVPMTLSFATPNIRWTRKIARIDVNTELDY